MKEAIHTALKQIHVIAKTTQKKQRVLVKDVDNLTQDQPAKCAMSFYFIYLLHFQLQRHLQAYILTYADIVDPTRQIDLELYCQFMSKGQSY